MNLRQFRIEFRENRKMDRNWPTTAPQVLGPEDYYFEGPNLVFTAAYHLKRGSCCESGCRHCPYRGTEAKLPAPAPAPAPAPGAPDAGKGGTGA